MTRLMMGAECEMDYQCCNVRESLAMAYSIVMDIECREGLNHRGGAGINCHVHWDGHDHTDVR
jgi:hypothetical protein